MRRYPNLIADAWVLAAVLAAATIAAAAFHVRGRPWASLKSHVYGVAALVFLASILLVPDANRRSGLREFGERLASVARPGDYVVVDQEGFEQILFYSRLRGTRRDFERTRVSVASDSVMLEPVEPGAGRRRRRVESPPPALHGAGDSKPPPSPMIAGGTPPAVRYPPGARVLFVLRESRVERLRSALGPASRTLLAAKLAGEPYFVVASRE